MQIFENMLNWILEFSQKVPVELYTIVGPFVEEILSPIPSPIIMASAGAIAQAQNKDWFFLIYLAILGAIGKTIASVILYYIADVAEDIFLKLFGRFIGLTHKDIESLGKNFNGTKKDWWVIFFARFIPIIPSSPISIVCGAIKTNVVTYTTATFFGSIFRNLFYLYFGYVGIAASQNVLDGMDSLESVVQIIIAIALVGVMGFLWVKKKKSNDGMDLLSKISKKEN